MSDGVMCDAQRMMLNLNPLCSGRWEFETCGEAEYESKGFGCGCLEEERGRSQYANSNNGAF